MPKIKKDGKHLNLFICSDVYNTLGEYSEEKGQTKTVAVERILRSYFEKYYSKKKG